MYVCATCACSAHRGQKRASDPLETGAIGVYELPGVSSEIKSVFAGVVRAHNH